VIPTIPELRAARTEKDWFEQLRGRWPLVDLRWLSQRPHILAAMRYGNTQLFHFATHGQRGSGPTAARIALDNGELTYQDVAGTPIRLGLGLAAPLVFLNACHSGRHQVSLAGHDGWVQRFLDLGCRGFVGANWMINDQLAARFATAFYDRMVAGEPLARAARLARKSIRKADPGNATWLAYAVYGHPRLRLEPPVAART
jgi:CHAT domain-containing protein